MLSTVFAAMLAALTLSVACHEGDEETIQYETEYDGVVAIVDIGEQTSGVVLYDRVSGTELLRREYDTKEWKERALSKEATWSARDSSATCGHESMQNDGNEALALLVSEATHLEWLSFLQTDPADVGDIVVGPEDVTMSYAARAEETDRLFCYSLCLEHIAPAKFPDTEWTNCCQWCIAMDAGKHGKQSCYGSDRE